MSIFLKNRIYGKFVRLGPEQVLVSAEQSRGRKATWRCPVGGWILSPENSAEPTDL